MTIASLTDIWRELRDARPVAEDQVAFAPVVVDGVKTLLQLAVDASGALHLLAPVQGSPARALPADLNGLRLRERRLGDQTCLDLCSPAAHEAMFGTLCNELVDAIAVQHREPWSAAISIVQRWQSAWRPLRQPMSRSAQIGMIGELLMLKTLWLPELGADAVHYWSGPDRERHDFVTARLHMEVKTTTRSLHQHEISRVDQLRTPEDRRLILASLQLEESVMGVVTLASLIDEIVDLIRQEPAALDGFLGRLDALDWSDEMRRSPELIRCHLRDAQMFEVDDEFPSLPADFVLPQGVLAVRYTISLANLPNLDVANIRNDLVAAVQP